MKPWGTDWVLNKPTSAIAQQGYLLLIYGCKIVFNMLEMGI
jgi:hypothetical protein